MAAVWSIDIRIQFATCLLALTYIPTWIMSPFTICLQVPPRYSNSWLSMFWDQLLGCTCIYTSLLILANLSSTIVSVARVLRVAFWRSKIALAHLMVGSGGEVVSLQNCNRHRPHTRRSPADAYATYRRRSANGLYQVKMRLRVEWWDTMAKWASP